MMMNNLLLIPASILVCGLSYLLLQGVLVRWACRTLLAGRVRLSQDPGPAQDKGSYKLSAVLLASMGIVSLYANRN